jgi:excinuclease UvrABC helicase subunit UvrB
MSSQTALLACLARSVARYWLVIIFFATQMTAELSAAVAAVKAISNQQTSVNQHSAFCETKCEQQKKAKICQSNWLWRKQEEEESASEEENHNTTTKKKLCQAKKNVNK